MYNLCIKDEFLYNIFNQQGFREYYKLDSKSIANYISNLTKKFKKSDTIIK